MLIPTNTKTIFGCETPMSISRDTEMSSYTASVAKGATKADPDRRQGLVAAGGVLGALAASSCCILPLALFSLGIGGAWIGNLTALAPYQPIFVAVTTGILGYGYYLVYSKPKITCEADATCVRSLPNNVLKISLWISTALVLLATAFPFIAPRLLG
jgi:mercuric ion transport protein